MRAVVRSLTVNEGNRLEATSIANDFGQRRVAIVTISFVSVPEQKQVRAVMRLSDDNQSYCSESTSVTNDFGNIHVKTITSPFSTVHEITLLILAITSTNNSNSCQTELPETRISISYFQRIKSIAPVIMEPLYK